MGSFPRQPPVTDDHPGQVQLGIGDQPGPAFGVLGTAHPRHRPAKGLPGEADGVLKSRIGAHRRATASPDPGTRSPATKPQHLRWTGLGGDARDLDADQGAMHDRPGPPCPTGRVQLLLGMQPRPRLHGHTTVLIIVFHVDHRG
jgi:hypothetical protein